MYTKIVEMIKIIILFALICDLHAIKLPNFIEKCNLTNPVELKRCAMKQGPKVISEFATKGYEPYIPPLDPFHIEKISIEGTRSLNITLMDMNITGLRNSILKSLDVDLPIKRFFLKILVPQIDMIGTYDISGKILLLNIEGHGPIKMIVTNLTFNYLVDFDFITKSDGAEYYKNIKTQADFDIAKVQFHLDNLFNGNKILGDQMNTFLNENWQEFAKDIRPAVSRTISSIITIIFDKFSGHIRKEDSFLY